MNDVRRKALRKIIDTLEGIQCELDELRTDECDCRDNIPENMQNSERYDRINEAADALDYACDNIEELIDNINGAIEA